MQALELQLQLANRHISGAPILPRCHKVNIKLWNFGQEIPNLHDPNIQHYSTVSYTVYSSWLFSIQKLSHKQQIWIFENLNFEKFIFQSSSGFQITEKSVSQITRLCLPRTSPDWKSTPLYLWNQLLIRMAYEGILTKVGWQSLISGNPALISGNLDEKKRMTRLS